MSFAENQVYISQKISRKSIQGYNMINEIYLLISLLKLTKNGPTLIGNVKEVVKFPSSETLKLIEKLQSEDLLKLNGDSVEIDSVNRLKLAVKAVSSGADVEAVSSFLGWQEFESITATALRNYGYTVLQNLRFKYAARKWEIDVVGCRKPVVVCFDCKDWHHWLSSSVLRRIVEAQVERTRALADTLPNVSLEIKCTEWRGAKFVPAILVLVPCLFKFWDRVPIVPVLQLQDFLNQLPFELESLKYFQQNFNHLSQ
jgi:Holliday junction resolvase-like predicted endonuclease